MGNDFKLLNYYLELALRRALIWVVPAFIVFSIGAFYVFTRPHSYYSEAVIVVRSQVIPSALVQSTVASERLQFIEQRVLARGNLLKLVEKFDLYPGLENSLSNSQLASLVRNQISITMRSSEPSDQLAGSSVFGIGATASSPELAAAMASEITAMITEENRRARMARATEATDFLEREVAVLTSRVGELDQQLAEFMRQNENALPSRLALHVGELRDGQSELAEIDQALSEARTDNEVLRGELTLAELQVGSRLEDQETQLSALRAELLSRSSVLSAQHPEIRSLKSRVAALEREIEQTEPASVSDKPDAETLARDLIAQRIAAGQQREQDLHAHRAALEARLSELRETVAAMPNVEADFMQLQREHEAAQVNLDDMRSRLNLARVGARLESDQQADQIQILEAPEAPLYASGTSRKEHMAAVLAASLALGFGCLFLADIYDPKIRGAFDIAPFMDEGPLLMIPDWRTPAEQRRRAIVTGVATAVVVAGVAIFARYHLSEADIAANASAGQQNNGAAVVGPAPEEEAAAWKG